VSAIGLDIVFPFGMMSTEADQAHAKSLSEERLFHMTAERPHAPNSQFGIDRANRFTHGSHEQYRIARAFASASWRLIPPPTRSSTRDSI
jgi:hypothetical protein